MKNEIILDALYRTIKKFKDMLELKEVDLSLQKFPICNIMPACRDCPVYHISSDFKCDLSPYAKFIEHWDDNHKNYYKSNDKHKSSFSGNEKVILCPTCEQYIEEEILLLMRAQHKFCIRQNIHFIGQKLKNSKIKNSPIYMICRSSYDKVCLINLESGNRFDEPIDVPSVYYITHDKFDLITKGGKNDFYPIEE